MAMRLLNRNNFERELSERLKLSATGEYTDSNQSQYWKTQNDKLILVPALPEGDLYPDHFFDTIENNIKALT